MAETIGEITELFLYPAKSMAGISSPEAHVGFDGLVGDRQYAFVRADQAAHNSFPWMTARQSARMLLYKPEFGASPTPDHPEPDVRVRTPEGESFNVADPALRDELAKREGHPVFLLKSARGLFDCQHVSVFSLATVRELANQAGCPIDPRQFRANVYIEPASGQAFDEERWTNSLLQIGDQVVIGVTQRDPRCMMINLDPESGRQDPRVLKTVVHSHEGQAGIYGNVVRGGRIRVGDAIRVISNL